MGKHHVVSEVITHVKFVLIRGALWMTPVIPVTSWPQATPFSSPHTRFTPSGKLSRSSFGVHSPIASTLVWPTPVQLCSFLNQVFTFMRLVLTRHPRMLMR